MRYTQVGRRTNFTFEAPMRTLLTAFLLILTSTPALLARVVVFWQNGFPTVASQPIARETLAQALQGAEPAFHGVQDLTNSATLAGVELLVLPYGSAVPADAWSGIQAYLRAGGNLLVLGGQALRVPVTGVNGGFRAAPPQDTYSRELDIRHSYEVPLPGGARFAWKQGYSFLGTPQIRARRFFALEGRWDGLGFMMTSDGVAAAAPVVVADHGGGGPMAGSMPGARFVLLDFEPEPGYWESPDGIALVRAASNYARRGTTSLSLELKYSAIQPGESPQITLRLRSPGRERQSAPLTGDVKVELLSRGAVIDTAQVVCSGDRVETEVAFNRALPAGFYTVRALYQDGGQPREFSQNGFWVEDPELLASGPVLGVKGDFLTRDGKPFFPVGTNYFTTDENGWDFAGPRNAWIWDRDFDEMARHGVSFVRTGVWMNSLRFLDPDTGAAPERFLRNLEAYLLSARNHGIIVNFTFYAFTPRPGPGPNGEMPLPAQQPAAAPPPAAAQGGPGRGGRGGAPQPPTGRNPYIDPEAIRAELNYVLSVVNRFKDVPFLCYDLINEPSFSNPGRLWTGNTPNGDPAEIAAWQKWLRERYGSVAELASAWSVTPEQLGPFDKLTLPAIADLAFTRYRNAREVRAIDYNLFAQEMFTQWVRAMVNGIRGAGSRQLVNVGQDEGGVTNRVLNQFYGAGGVAFTTNHTYWRDDALLWDSVAAKRPGMPNITGETGYQPVWSTDGAWRYDESTGLGLTERKWALGFAAASSGALQWDWAREVDFGIKRSDGSAKIWQSMMRDMGQFAEKLSPWATELVPPQVAIVLPQSLQLSVLNTTALEAQQKCVRALYQYARAEAYAVGEYQIELLGNPKLIIVPSAFGLTAGAWEALRGKVRNGATLLLSGPFAGDAHLHPTGRQKDAGLDYELSPLTIRENSFRWPGGEALLTFGGERTTYLDRAALPDGSQWAEAPLGKGKLLFAALPLELNDNLQAVGDVYRYALKTAGVAATYTTGLQDPGILICPSRFPHATLYVLASESARQDVAFRDEPSGKQFSGALDPGRAAMLLVGEDGGLLAAYNWKSAR
ncbi:MAG TPA: beta-galactosidase [Bryobacteraceae bacterium]|nr:beta-galactosidase [Bryobacteraceae bacterium]